MTPDPFVFRSHPGRGGDTWFCRTCRASFGVKPADACPWCSVPEPTPSPSGDARLIAVSVSIFSALIVIAWAFALWMGWL